MTKKTDSISNESIHQTLHYLPTLTIRVFWLKDHKENSDNPSEENPDPVEKLAFSIYSEFCRPVQQQLDRGMGIPVFFHDQLLSEPAILEQSHHTILVVLVNDDMVINPKRNEGLAALSRAVMACNHQHRIYPISLTVNAFNLNPIITTANLVRHRLYYETFAR